MHTGGVYSKNPPGFRYDPPSPAKRFIPDVDGNWPAGVPGTPGATEYIRPQGYWVNDSDWETKFAPNMSNDSILESPTNTDGFIDAQSGTVKTLLPPNSRSFILGPLVDGYNWNHGYDDFTRIGYIQKDTRQFVLLATIQGHWDTTRDTGQAINGGRANREWNGTSSQFTAYNSNFTLAMAQWFKDRITANDFTKNFPYFYSGGVFQGPLSNQPPGSPGGMNGGNAAGTGGGGNDPSDGDGEAAVGSGGTPDIGTETPQGDTEGGDPGDLNLWGLFKKGVDTAKGVYSKITGSRLGQYGAMIAAKSTIGIMDNIVYGGSKYLLKGVGAGRKFNPKFTGAGPSTGTFGRIFKGKKLVDWGDSLINGSINRISKSIGGPANFAPNLFRKMVGRNYAGQWFTDPTRVNVATGYAKKAGAGGTATLIPRTAGKFGWKNWLGSNTSRSLAMQPETYQRTEDILNVMEGATKTLKGFGKNAKKIGGARLNLDIDNPKTQRLLQRYAAKVATNSKTLKTIARGIPFLGAGISMADAAHRFSTGDWKGGALSIASMVPGPVGWFALGAQVSVDTGALEKGIEFAYNRQTGFNPDTGTFEPRTNQDWDARRAARGGGDRNEYGQNIKVTPGAPAKPIGNAETSKIDLEIANIKVELSKPSTKDYEKNRLNQRLNRARQRLETAYNKLDSDHERNVQDWEARRSARGSSYKPPSSNTGNTGNTGQLPGDTAPGADVPAENTSREVNGIIEYNRGLKTDPNGREYYEILRYPKGGSLYSPRAYTFKSYIDDGTTQKDSDDPGMPSNPDFRGPGNNKDFKPEDKPKPFDWWKGGGSDEPEPEKDYERNRRRNRPRTQFNDYMLDGDFLLEEKQEQYMNANMGELQDEMRKAGIPIDDPQEMADQFGLASLAAGMNPEIVEIIQLAIINAPLTPQQQEDISKAMLDFASVIYANEKAEQIYGKNTNELADKDDEGLDEQIEIIINEDKKIEEREEKKRILREITQPLKEIKELPKTQKLEKYRPNFAGKYKPQNTPNVTASKKSDEMVKAKNAAGQTWRTKDKYWGGYESQERMNVVYDNVGHGNQYFDKIVSENLSKKNIKNRQVQEHLNIIAHEKAMRQLDSSFVSPFKSIEEQETYDNKVKDPLFSKVSDRLNKEINYEKKPSPKGYPNEAPPKMDPDTGMHPKYGKRYKYDKLDPQSAEAMPVQGNPEIDANVQKSLDKRAKDRKIKNLTVNTTNEKVDWRETLQKRNVGESKKNFKNLRKDLQEQLYTNVTTGMKVGQTLRHIPSGQTFTTGGALGGTETLPSTFSIFGDPTPAPDVTDVSSYPLQGYAKPMNMMRRKNRENLEDINARLDASQEFAQNVNSDVMMNARVSDIDKNYVPPEVEKFADKDTLEKVSNGSTTDKSLLQKTISISNKSSVVNKVTDSVLKGPLSKYKAPVKLFLGYLTGTIPENEAHTVLTKNDVKQAWSDLYIDPSSNALSVDGAMQNVIGGESLSQLSLSADGKKAKLKFGFQPHTNEKEFAQHPDKYKGYQKLAMNLLGPYAADLQVGPGIFRPVGGAIASKMTEISKVVDFLTPDDTILGNIKTGKNLKGEIEIDINKLKNGSWNQKQVYDYLINKNNNSKTSGRVDPTNTSDPYDTTSRDGQLKSRDELLDDLDRRRTAMQNKYDEIDQLTKERDMKYSQGYFSDPVTGKEINMKEFDAIEKKIDKLYIAKQREERVLDNELHKILTTTPDPYDLDPNKRLPHDPTIKIGKVGKGVYDLSKTYGGSVKSLSDMQMRNLLNSPAPPISPEAEASYEAARKGNPNLPSFSDLTSDIKPPDNIPEPGEPGWTYLEYMAMLDAIADQAASAEEPIAKEIADYGPGGTKVHLVKGKPAVPMGLIDGQEAITIARQNAEQALHNAWKAYNDAMLPPEGGGSEPPPDLKGKKKGGQGGLPLGSTTQRQGGAYGPSSVGFDRNVTPFKKNKKNVRGSGARGGRKGRVNESNTFSKIKKFKSKY